jgi:antitoxin MazE
MVAPPVHGGLKGVAHGGVVMGASVERSIAKRLVFRVYPVCIHRFEKRCSVRARIAKWGNSLGVRIPKAVAKKVGLDEGADVEVKISGRNLVLAPARREYSLNELVVRIRPKNRHGETGWGAPVGNENW